jgi:hypothetical protein
MPYLLILTRSNPLECGLILNNLSCKRAFATSKLAAFAREIKIMLEREDYANIARGHIIDCTLPTLPSVSRTLIPWGVSWAACEYVFDCALD